ncbi:hypothetical protein COU20_02815 [Candidatus Kaiserbacteria bacterium CG10_big_fil_rev_8_21_14_0_10_59_10]|uniref:ATP-grasp domain-containing protein n=1 Tax=Candidatus Kaiserbacteria bacterium CG10_big_fil_rev_8_21_14_0_10_59_10 TaxID=1974612 RepID=A0A2H0U7E2_9BACT|nr:MAG: hypothetical protein COU20_02815 [Candidatus Kaiserbacteria bacterium CG10_big_fil_rev_8_21_14_0_10_59_10]
MARTYDIGIGWTDPVEQAFAELLSKEAKKRKRSFRQITLETMVDDLAALERGDFHISTYLDRGFFESFGFTLAAQLLEARGAHVINSPAAVARASSKAHLYPLLKKARLPLPDTYLITRKTPHRELARIARKLGAPFVVVSSYGLGDAKDRVLLTAEDADDIEGFMEGNFADTFLAHTYVQPAVLHGRTAWFRPIHACGDILPLWWEPLSGFYRPFGSTHEERQIASEMETHMRTIRGICGLDLFSAEFALTPEGTLLLIDYANNPIDLNSSDKVQGGLPPKILERIAHALTARGLSGAV